MDGLGMHAAVRRGGNRPAQPGRRPAPDRCANAVSPSAPATDLEPATCLPAGRCLAGSRRVRGV
jgi:hypothetical protein